MKLVRKHFFLISLTVIVLLASFLRFYRYDQRWGLAYDQAHDAVVARYALQNRELPLVGPFSSAGPFQTGGEWYWFIMLGTMVYPNSILTPWIVLTTLFVLFVVFISLLGKELINEKFGLLVGLLAMVSPAQLSQSTNLTNQSLLALTSLFAIWAMIRHYRTKKPKYIFLLGFCISLGFTIHLQGVSLLVLAGVYFLVKRVTLKELCMFILGIVIPIIPILVWDIKNNFVNTQSMIRYYLVDQYQISYEQLNRRWLTYLFSFLPSIWGEVIAGNKTVGFVAMIFMYAFFWFAFFKKMLNKELQILFLASMGILILLRYIRAPIFPSYFLFFHPFIFILTGWVIYSMGRLYFVIGFLVITLLLVSSLILDKKEIMSASNYSYFKSQKVIEYLDKNYPNKKFSVYDYNYRFTTYSLPVVLNLYTRNKIDDNGIGIGFGKLPPDEKLLYHEFSDSVYGEEIWDINASDSVVLGKKGWGRVNPSSIYKATEDWHKTQ